MCAVIAVLLLVVFLVPAMAQARTVEQVVAEHGPAARARLRPDFDRAGLVYPPRRVWLLAFKEERRLELWAGDRRRLHVKDYAIQAASGGAGPKRREGDQQVPEGLYAVLWLNPNSGYHLSMKLDYPNVFDRAKARTDGRTQLGGDIFIHGRAVSIGCLAMGDPAIEELFVLAAEAGVANVHAVVAPHDLRKRPVRLRAVSDPPWLGELYAALETELTRFPD